MAEIADRKLETKLVKDALAKAGIKARVGHGHGTAWGWLHVYVGSNPFTHTCPKHSDDVTTGQDDCLACMWYGQVPPLALKIALDVTGRQGEYDGRINVLTQ